MLLEGVGVKLSFLSQFIVYFLLAVYMNNSIYIKPEGFDYYWVKLKCLLGLESLLWNNSNVISVVMWWFEGMFPLQIMLIFPQECPSSPINLFIKWLVSVSRWKRRWLLAHNLNIYTSHCQPEFSALTQCRGHSMVLSSRPQQEV